LKRVVKFDGITLDYPMFISTEFDIDNYIGKKRLTIDGSSVLFVQPKGALTNEVQIYSKDSGWVSDSIKNSLIDTVDELAKIVEYDDATTDTFYFDHTKVPLTFTPLYSGALWYNVTFNLLKG
jgi:hypothetical protein